MRGYAKRNAHGGVRSKGLKPFLPVFLLVNVTRGSFVRSAVDGELRSASGRERHIDAVQFEMPGHLSQQAQQLFAVSLGKLVEQGGGLPACWCSLL